MEGFLHSTTPSKFLVELGTKLIKKMCLKRVKNVKCLDYAKLK